MKNTKIDKIFEVGKKYTYYTNDMAYINGEWQYAPSGYVEVVSRTPIAMIDGYIGSNHDRARRY